MDQLGEARGNDEIEIGDDEYRIKEEMRIVAVAEDVASDVLVSDVLEALFRTTKRLRCGDGRLES